MKINGRVRSLIIRPFFLKYSLQVFRECREEVITNNYAVFLFFRKRCIGYSEKNVPGFFAPQRSNDFSAGGALLK